MNNEKVLVEIKDLQKHFPLKKNEVLRAVDDVNLIIYKGETLGVVGESGCGKSTLGRTIIRLYEPTNGEVIYNGEAISDKLKLKKERELQREIQMIFQDPYSSLNPRMTVQEIISEGLIIQKPNMSRKEQRETVYTLLETVGLNRNHASRYPHEFSGGQRQRIGIARALA